MKALLAAYPEAARERVKDSRMLPLHCAVNIQASDGHIVFMWHCSRPAPRRKRRRTCTRASRCTWQLRAKRRRPSWARCSRPTPRQPRRRTRVDSHTRAASSVSCQPRGGAPFGEPAEALAAVCYGPRERGQPKKSLAIDLRLGDRGDRVVHAEEKTEGSAACTWQLCIRRRRLDTRGDFPDSSRPGSVRRACVLVKRHAPFTKARMYIHTTQSQRSRY